MLAARSGDAFHLGSAWFDCWSAAFGPVIRDAGLTLVARRERLGPLWVASLHSATNPHSVHFDAAPGASLPAGLPARLFAEHGVAMLRFDYLAQGAALLAAARGWAMRHRVRIAPHALAPVVDCRGGYDRWVEARSKRIRQRLRSSAKQAFGRLAMTVEFRTDDPTATGVFAQMLAVERSGWKGRAGTAISDQPGVLGFYTALVRAAAAQGALQVALLWQGERLVAFELGVTGGRRLFLLKVGYDERFGDISAGYLLAAEHIRHCFGQPAIDWYDKMGNGMHPAEYKLRFADHCDPLYRVTVYHRGLRGTLMYVHDGTRARARAWRDARRRTA